MSPVAMEKTLQSCSSRIWTNTGTFIYSCIQRAVVTHIHSLWSQYKQNYNIHNNRFRDYSFKKSQWEESQKQMQYSEY